MAVGRAGWLGMVLLLAGCGGYERVEVEVGHRGVARLDPFLAAGRFLTELGHQVRVERRWPQPDDSMGLLLMPVSMLEAKGYVDELREWVAGGGHLVCLFGWSSAARSDWSWSEPAAAAPSAALADWLREAGWEVGQADGADKTDETDGADKTDKTDETDETDETDGAEGADAERPVPRDGAGLRRLMELADRGRADRWRFDGRAYQVTHAGERCFVPVDGDGRRRSFVSSGFGQGRLTLVSDARPFRNRHIGDGDHAPLLAALADGSGPGTVVIVLGSDVSFWRLVWAAGWPVLVALVVLLVVWLWRALPRFGPLEANARIDDWRDYRRHLDAVGGFFWRIDRGRQLLEPLRREVLERLQRRRLAAGREVDLHDLAATISGVPRARVERALAEQPPADQAGYTRTAADLQQLLERL